MLVRVRSTAGTIRVQVEQTDSLLSLYEAVQGAMAARLPPASTFILYRSSSVATTTTTTPVSEMNRQMLQPETNVSLASIGIQHGDMLLLECSQPIPLPSAEREASASVHEAGKVKQDAVDDYLQTQSGLISRNKNPQFCRHGEKGMCDYCLPLEPYDPAYLEENKIKHLSFHAYLRKLTAGNGKLQGAATSSAESALGKSQKVQQSFSSNVLSEPEYSVKTGCTGGHPPYPAGICTKCQPSAIILGQQPYRMVDHVEFASPHIIDDFLMGWRRTGCQRFAYMYGHYEPYEAVPLGIKAVVEAIYEAPQEGAMTGFQLVQPDPLEQTVDMAASTFGLVKVGMIYTDLIDDGSGQGKVLCRRNTETFFASSAECLFMARQQLLHPSPSNYSSTGHYGSKFITVIISGDEEHNIVPHAYQVSETCTAMHRADLIEASVEPGLMLVRQPSPDEQPARYIPEVFYCFKNEYGAQVQQAAQPSFPVEYLLVTLSHGAPVVPAPVFKSVEYFSLQSASLTKVKQYLEKAALPEALSNFNFFVHLHSMNIFSAEDSKVLARCIIAYHQQCSSQSGPSDVSEIKRQIENLPSWRTLLTAIREEESASRSSTGGASGSQGMAATASSSWSCPHCTFVNCRTSGDAVTDTCEICGLPRLH